MCFFGVFLSFLLENGLKMNMNPITKQLEISFLQIELFINGLTLTALDLLLLFSLGTGQQILLVSQDFIARSHIVRVISLSWFDFIWLHHTRALWLRSQLIHVKRLLNPLCKLPIEVFIQHYITVFTQLMYSSSRSLTVPFPFLDQSLTALPLPAAPPLAAACMATAMYGCTQTVRLCLPLPGAAAEVAQLGGRGRDKNQAELSWDSMNTAGPFQRQSGSKRPGGMGSISFSVQIETPQEQIRNMLRMVSTEGCSDVNSVCGCKDVLDQTFELEREAASKQRLPWQQ